MPIDDSELNSLTGIRLPTPIAPACPQCQYNLTGLVNAICPECGYRFDWKSVRRKARAQWLDALGLKTLPEEIEFGFRVTCIAWGIALFIGVCRGLMEALSIRSFTLLTVGIVLYLMQVLAAFCGAFLCSHILRFQRLAEEVREALRVDVPVARAWMGLIGAAVLLLFSLLPCLGLSSPIDLLRVVLMRMLLGRHL